MEQQVNQRGRRGWLRMPLRRAALLPHSDYGIWAGWAGPKFISSVGQWRAYRTQALFINIQ